MRRLGHFTTRRTTMNSIDIAAVQCLLLVFCGSVTAADVITKCLTSTESRVRIKCPKRHVLYKPEALVGVGKDGTCSRSRDDCTGMTRNLRTELERCYWKRYCYLTLCKNHAIDSKASGNCTGMVPTYLLLHQPYCIPKGIILDMCSNVSRKISQTSGVLRSHVTHPEYRKTGRRLCKARIPIKPSQTAYISVAELSNSRNSSQEVSIWTVYKHNKTKVSVRGREKLTFTGDTARMIIIQLRQRKGCSKGFSVPFSVYNTADVQALMEWPKSSFPIMKKIGCILEVKAFVEQCTVEEESRFELSCGIGEVIYSPRLSMAGYTQKQAQCLYGDYPCGGYTPELLVQAHSCYWQNNCSVSSGRHDLIIYSSDVQCVGYVASILGFSGHSCIAQEKIHDVCPGGGEAVRDDWGIIRSHDTYPWYFDPKVGRCKRNIRVGEGKRLMIMVYDMELDPDGRDKFSLVHLNRKSRTTVMTVKEAGRRNHWIQVESGVLRIQFTPVKGSKAGRGFVLLFRRYKINPTRSPARQLTSSFQKDVGKQIQNDISTPSSQRAMVPCRRSRRNRKCGSLTWTDRFTGFTGLTNVYQ